MYDLYAPLTFFNHKNRVTWRSFNKEKVPFQLDQWLTNSLDLIKHSKVVNYGIPSDHIAIQIKLKFNTKKRTILKNLNNINWTLFLNTDVKENFDSRLKNKVNELRFDNNNFKLNYKIFSNFITTSAKESAIVPLNMNSGWYNLSTDILKPLMDKRSRTLD